MNIFRVTIEEARTPALLCFVFMTKGYLYKAKISTVQTYNRTSQYEFLNHSQIELELQINFPTKINRPLRRLNVKDTMCDDNLMSLDSVFYSFSLLRQE